ncbi:STAS domain-containing protein [Streptomyces roseus]|uniref:Anti-sigma factor antagonist n=1 Tax=Streptomyces roseus TaxID=66430 RepID=A0A0J7ADN4_9ACTN|nr:STAS domain-containing protein [Streptomyces roseus]KMO95341.1 anti-sigma factor antagonist [Streptomyces roseus]MYT22150.1 STAS domain-containing protein [Streptomyces sp. SID7760]
MTRAGDSHHEGVVGKSYPAGAGWVVAAHGELDQDTLAPLEEALATAADRYRLVVLDAAAVTFGDSSFLNLLLRVHHLTTLRIAAPGEQLSRLFALTGADTVLSVHPSVEDALGGS